MSRNRVTLGAAEACSENPSIDANHSKQYRQWQMLNHQWYHFQTLDCTVKCVVQCQPELHTHVPFAMREYNWHLQ